MNKEFLIHALADFGIKNKFHVEPIENYYDRLIEQNKVMNLTTITDEREFILKHICDSLAPLLFLNINSKKCIDVGTGAGFPGIPLKIFENSLSMDYAESVRKKADFVKETLNNLGLEGKVFINRAEDLGRDKILRESYDMVFTRAVSSLNVLVEYCIPLLKIGGLLVAYKGPEPKKEVEKAKTAMDTLHCSVKSVYEYTLPYTDINHTLIVIEKFKNTPKSYPRPTAKIKKSPL